MQRLKYAKKSDGSLVQESNTYHIGSAFKQGELSDMFLKLKANVCDLNPAFVTKCITGTEQDFIMLMNRARDFVDYSFPGISAEVKKQLLEMFQQCVFGYHVLTHLILAKDVSDIKVLDYNHIVIKANGERYVTDVSFYSE